MKTKTLKFILLVLLIKIAANVSAQDLILTQAGDSIKCTILNKTQDGYEFCFQDGNEMRTSMIPYTEVRLYTPNYYGSQMLKSNNLENQLTFQKLRFSASVGLGYRTARLPDGLNTLAEDYLKKLRTGYVVYADLTYFTSNMFGFGLMASYNAASSSITNGGVKYSDDVSILYIGPTFRMRSTGEKEKNIFWGDLSMGLISYKDLSQGDVSATLTGQTFGMTSSLGWDIWLSKASYLCLKLSSHVGVLREMTVKSGGSSTKIKLEKDQAESLARIDLTVGIVFSKW